LKKWLLFWSWNRNRNRNSSKVGTGPEPYLLKSRKRNHNFSKVGTGTGTIKNSYGSTTLKSTATRKVHRIRLRYIISKLLKVFERAAAGVQEDERNFVTGLQVRLGRLILRLFLQSVYVYWQVFAPGLHPDSVADQ
jgi:hypothetical protein